MVDIDDLAIEATVVAGAIVVEVAVFVVEESVAVALVVEELAVVAPVVEEFVFVASVQLAAVDLSTFSVLLGLLAVNLVAKKTKE